MRLDHSLRWRRNTLEIIQISATTVFGRSTAALFVSLIMTSGDQTLPYRDPAQLVVVWERLDPTGEVGGISGPDIVEFRDSTHNVFSSFGGFVLQRVWLFDRQGTIEIRACPIQATVLADLGMRTVLGRAVKPDDQALGDSATAPAWISFQLWQTHYGSSTSVIGSTIGIGSSAAGHDNLPVQIVGVLPARASVQLPFMDNQTDVWYLLPRDISSRSRQSAVFLGLGRLLPGSSGEQAEAALVTVAQRLGERYGFERARHPVVVRLQGIAETATAH